MTAAQQGMTEEEVAAHRAKCLEMVELGDHGHLYYEVLNVTHQPSDADQYDDSIQTLDWRPREWWSEHPDDWDEEDNRDSLAGWVRNTKMPTEPCDPECYAHSFTLRWEALDRRTGRYAGAAEPAHMDEDGRFS